MKLHHSLRRLSLLRESDAQRRSRLLADLHHCTGAIMDIAKPTYGLRQKAKVPIEKHLVALTRQISEELTQMHVPRKYFG